MANQDIQRIPVTSSNVSSVGHDGDSTLEVEYNNSRVYQFFPVSEGQYQQILASPSIGRAINALGIRGMEV